MTTHKIITIGRQFGSGGHEIGNLLATRLDIPLYDNNLVRMAAEKMDIREETAKAIDETSLNSFVSSYLITPMGYSSYINSEEYVQPLSEQMYELQTEIIKKLAERGPCVIVGRCADYILKDNPNCINVFICADRADRIKRIAERYDVSEKKALSASLLRNPTPTFPISVKSRIMTSPSAKNVSRRCRSVRFLRSTGSS